MLERKLKAVTIIELVVVMTIAGIMVFIGYMGFYIVQQQFGHYQRMGENLVDLERLNTLLARDFFEAEEVLYLGNGIEVVYPQGIQTIIYQFDWEEIIRSNEASIDTFDYWTDSVQVYFLGEAQNGMRQPIDYFSIQVGDSIQKTTFQYEKEYAAEYLMSWSRER